jgi:hypothetical protein
MELISEWEKQTNRMDKHVNTFFLFWNDSDMHVSLHVMYTILHADLKNVPHKTTLISITCSQTVLLLQPVTAFTNAHIYLFIYAEGSCWSECTFR